MERHRLSVTRIAPDILIRRDIITLLCKSQTGHTGGPLSCSDFGTAMFFHEMSLDPSGKFVAFFRCESHRQMFDHPRVGIHRGE